MHASVAVDIGGTKLAIALIRSDGVIEKKIKRPVQKRSVDESVQQLVDGVQQLLREAELPFDKISGIGVIVPGIYFAETGDAWAPNLWGGDPIPLRSNLESKLAAPIVIDSDRAGYVLGEQWQGVARGLSDVVFLAVGTGIGAGILMGGQMCRGVGDVAGAVGWFALDSQKKEIYKQMGCFESEAAGPAVARRAVARLNSGRESILKKLAPVALNSLTAEDVVEAARQNDSLALEVLEETAVWLGRGIANLISVLNPAMVVLGGGLMQDGDLLLETARREALEWAQPHAAQQARIELSQLGEDAGVLGAARLVFMQHNS